MAAGGSFQTSREIFEHPIWQDVTKFRLFFYIYGQAVFSDTGVRYGDVFLKRGQYLRSYRNLRKDLEYIENRQVKSYSISTIKRTIDKLVKENRLLIEDTELGTLFTVVNYEEYQGFGSIKKENMVQQGNSVGTVAEQSRNNNNKDKKDKKDIKEIKPSIDYESEFDLFWNIYKKKADKKNAFLKFKIARKKFSLEKILHGTSQYMRQCEIKNTAKNYIKGPAVFLHGENFNDEFDLQPVNTGRRSVGGFLENFNEPEGSLIDGPTTNGEYHPINNDILPKR